MCWSYRSGRWYFGYHHIHYRDLSVCEWAIESCLFFSPATTAHPSFIGSLISSDHIPYNSFWTWFWWIILGIVYGLLGTFVITSIKNHELDAEAFFGGIFNGIFWGTLCGFLTSLLFNFLHVPAGFLASIGVECLIVTFFSMVG